MSIDYSRFVPNVVFEKIPISNLVSDQNYQRQLSQTQIVKAVQDFDLYQINPVKVSRRDGVNYVFDGQHTIEIIANASGSRDTPVWCMIFDDLFYEREAQIFADQQRHSRQLTSYDVYIAQLEAGNEKYLMINSLIKSYNLEIANNAKSDCCICAVAALISIYDKHGFHTLDKVLRLCIGAWQGEKYSLTSNMLVGLARLISAYGDLINEETFVSRLGSISPRILARTAKERRPGSLGHAEVMLQLYNKKCRYRLPLKLLYVGTSIVADEEEEFDDE